MQKAPFNYIDHEKITVYVLSICFAYIIHAQFEMGLKANLTATTSDLTKTMNLVYTYFWTEMGLI